MTQINELDFYAKQAVLLTAEDRSAFQNIASTYQAELNPQSAAERTLFALIILAVWNIERVNRLESAQASAEGLDPLLSQSPTAKRLAAYRLNAERSFHKNLAEYRKLKADTSRQEEAAAAAKPKLKNEPNFIAAPSGRLALLQHRTANIPIQNESRIANGGKALNSDFK